MTEKELNDLFRMKADAEYLLRSLDPSELAVLSSSVFPASLAQDHLDAVRQACLDGYDLRALADVSASFPLSVDELIGSAAYPPDNFGSVAAGLALATESRFPFDALNIASELATWHDELWEHVCITPPDLARSLSSIAQLFSIGPNLSDAVAHIGTAMAAFAQGIQESITQTSAGFLDSVVGIQEATSWVPLAARGYAANLQYSQEASSLLMQQQYDALTSTMDVIKAATTVPPVTEALAGLVASGSVWSAAFASALDHFDEAVLPYDDPLTYSARAYRWDEQIQVPNDLDVREDAGVLPVEVTADLAPISLADDPKVATFRVQVHFASYVIMLLPLFALRQLGQDTSWLVSTAEGQVLLYAWIELVVSYRQLYFYDA